MSHLSLNLALSSLKCSESVEKSPFLVIDCVIKNTGIKNIQKIVSAADTDP